jgi:hypothetical protein
MLLEMGCGMLRAMLRAIPEMRAVIFGTHEI